jgi:hypothetical protein
VTRSRSTWSRATGLFGTVVALVVVQMAALAAPASAGYGYTDSLESNTQPVWELSGSGAGNQSYLYSDCGAARTGCGAAMLKQVGPGWHSVGRSWYINSPLGRTCRLAGHLQRRLYGSQLLQVNIEVLDPATWKYISWNPVALDGPGSGAWEDLHTTFRLSQRQVFVRFSVIGDAAGHDNVVNLDDVSVSCD